MPNTPQAPKAGPTARDVGMVTDGASLKTGYKVLPDNVGRSPQPVPTHNK